MEINKNDTIFLCGFMGAGKTTIGKALAGAMGRPFADLDSLIEEKAGKTIPQLFREEGESHFRTLERAVLAATARDFKGVLSLGGGALHDPGLVQEVKLAGLLVFIETPISVILERIKKNEDRPLLLNDKGELKKLEVLQKELPGLYEQRLPLYRMADITLHTDRFDSAGEAAEELIQKIKEYDEAH